jgi:small-conductance mechanosensitive channel
MAPFRRQDAKRAAVEVFSGWRPSSARHLRERARKARRSVVLLTPLLIGVYLVYRYRMKLFGLDEPIRIACAIALVALGSAFARDLGRAIYPSLMKQVDPGTAGTIGFLLRLGLLVIASVVALRIAGLTPRTLAVGGAVSAIILGLAAQTTIGNLFAGMLLLSVRPFKVGERVRLQAGALAGQVEGTVSQLGLLYVTLTHGEDVILVPNNTVVQSAIVPLREPSKVDLRARLRPGVKPSELQHLIEDMVTTPTREPPHIELEEVDDEEVIMRVTAIPLSDADGPRLADEVLQAVNAVTKPDPDGNGASFGRSR